MSPRSIAHHNNYDPIHPYVLKIGETIHAKMSGPIPSEQSSCFSFSQSCLVAVSVDCLH